MGVINILGSEISNKIAAGEVVERPSSVVKELVENSLDAGASKITVEIQNGGSVFLRVTDNGCGMSADDAKICFLRHATSKIKTDADLCAIYTLGFRGEALSSIGAVAQVTLRTRQKGNMSGICVTCRGGELIASEDAGTPEGTDITVENLFYNTPARLKFLKKDSTEAGYITDIMTKFIFAYPSVSFRLISNGREKLFSAGDSSLINAVYSVYGRDYAKHMLPVDYEQDGVKVTGLAGVGTISRPNRNYQSYFVNGRYIKSPVIIRAAEEAYKNQIMIGKFPAVILNIGLNAELIDINVHPTKLEVKFSDERLVYQAVYYAVRNTLYREANVPKIERVRNEETKPAKNGSAQLYLSDLTANLPKQSNFYPVSKSHDAGKAPRSNAKSNQPPVHAEPDIRDITRRPETPGYNPKINPFIEDNSGSSQAGRAAKDDGEKKNLWYVADPSSEKNDGKTDETEQSVFADEYFGIVGQIFDTYIIAQKNDEMLIIDQHAAHERLKYEELKADLEKKQSFSQMLIEPVVVSMTGQEYAAFETISDTLYDMGFDCEAFGENTVMVRAVPGETELGETEDLLLELISEAAMHKKELISERRQRLLYTIACKAAVKANMKMSADEMKTLVSRVLRLENINTCPHGRPIIITMSKKELEKEFGRIV